MRFTVSAVSAVLAMASSTLAQTTGFDAVNVPASGQQIPAGTQFTIEWDVPANYASDTVSLQLIGGHSQGTQVPQSVIATGVPNSDGKFVWSIDPALGGLEFYGIIIRSEMTPDVYQYSNPFQIVAAASQSTAAATTITTPNQSQTVISSSAVPTAADVSGTTTITVDATTTVPIGKSTCTSTTLTTSTREPAVTPVVTPVDSAPAAPTSATSPAPVSAAAPVSPAAPAPPVGEASAAPAPPPALIGQASAAPAAPAAPAALAAGTGPAALGAAQPSSWTPPVNPPAPTAPPSGLVVSGATRTTGSMAIIGGLVLAFFAL